MATVDSVSLRAEKAASILSVPASDLLKILSDEGISNDEAGLTLLSSPAVTVEDLTNALAGKSVMVIGEGNIAAPKEIKKLPAKAAAGVLKGSEGPKQDVIGTGSTKSLDGGISVIAQLLKENKPLEQWTDADLLKYFTENRTYEAEQELDRRAKHQKFVVLKDPLTQGVKKYEPGKEVIDIEKSLDLLKTCRKRATPGVIPIEGGFAVVYRITELNPKDRIVEICPICGETLWNGYCEKCQVTFVDLSDEARAFVWLVVNTPGMINASSLSDRKALMASAAKGVDDLKKTWPALAPKFEEMVLTSNLPKLRVIENRPSTTVADPYHVGGNRMFGNVSY